MAKQQHPTLIVMMHRNPHDPDLLDYTFAKVWHTGKYTDKGGRVPHRRLLREGSFIHPEEVHDITLVVDGVSVRAQSPVAGGVPRTPGRERSGLEHVLPQPEHPLELPPTPTATTPDQDPQDEAD